MEFILEVNNLEKKYKDFKALNNLCMNVPKGSIYGFIGKNGAGKTTLIRIISGLQNPDNGSYSIYGTNYGDKDIVNVRSRIGAIIETPSIYMDMTARQNLIEQYKLIGMPLFEGIDELLKQVGLSDTQNKKVKNFSLGMKQRLGIAIALASSPDFLILDEPINGLDPQGIIEIRELILNLNKKMGITILVSSHYLDELSKIATYYGFIDNGRIVREISAKELNSKMQKKIIIKVNDVKECVKYLELANISYEVENNNIVNIFGKVNISEIVLELSKKNCVIEEIHEVEESLENYYINLIGGDKNV